ncbi:Cell division protein MraZ [Thioalkalivibrio nitratireducens DSM 14787]|uniref:Transcriptional regulator MraZ n=1 Tax=Thioalkalivibrio nitratireducens (strain DSM 14787 / UNIQEM 213 / ALEN2) TaxID=1255043 RepID=L0DXD2_THIND|nr:division/cell wall cluster transcriptional repressor MraZ [Thioalkalivibrio nitratireducens]AGA34254.1 Cell division protein MraZ [Thioalkalivibrio nitratireducens DSM 14787]
MFRGLSQLSLDAKGRIAVPARYREALVERCQGRMVVTVDRDGCLLLYPAPDWERIEQTLMSRPNMNPQVRRLQRLLVGHATECELDGQGRLLVPPPLREFAGLEKRVMLVGQGSKFEIWDEDTWSRNRELWFGEDADGSLSDALESIAL